MKIQLQDFDRQVVKSDYATLFIPVIEFEQPPSKRGGIEWLLVLINIVSTFQVSCIHIIYEHLYSPMAEIQSHTIQDKNAVQYKMK